MIRRLFWALLGLGLGVVLGVRVVRRLDHVADSARPTTVAERAGRRVGGTRSRWQDAVAAGRSHARASERELRARYDVPTLGDLADLGGRGTDARSGAARSDD